MPKLILAFAVALFILSFSACVPAHKLYYFHDKLPGRDTIDTMHVQKIKKNDRLSITVSSTDPALTAYLNPFNNQNGGGAQQNNYGYLVNPDGKIEFLLFGQVAVAGLTTVEAASLLKEKLAFYYKDIFVNVNLRGQVFFINGRTGTTIPVSNERLTIFEAMAQAGSQDPYDKKDDVWLIREDSGMRTYAKLNLNSKTIFQSPYYYLQNNDLIYLQPGRFASFFSTNSPGRSVLTITAALLSIYVALKKL